MYYNIRRPCSEIIAVNYSKDGIHRLHVTSLITLESSVQTISIDLFSSEIIAVSYT